MTHSRYILVTGGAGYIGSHTAQALARRGFVPVVYDNFSNGHRWAVKWGPLVEGDIADKPKLVDTIRRYEISAVVHFAAYAYVGESMEHPARYYENNVIKSLALLDAVQQASVRYFVFSSTCATYGVPSKVPITENCPQNPVNPYGATKLAIERALEWYARAYSFTWVALRYFNAAGSDHDCETGEVHSPETHLIPLILDAADGGRQVAIYGNDYPTPDGTCIRDYIHVSDLADAHILALEYLENGGTSLALNLGTGEGHSIMQIVDTVQEVVGRNVPFRIADRREGDPAILVADPSLARNVLGWHAPNSQLANIIQTAWKWRCARPKPDRDINTADSAKKNG